MALAQTLPPPVKVRPELEEFFLELPAEFVTRHRPPARVQALAACRGMDVDLFFPTNNRYVRPAARAVCESCPVSTECGEWARQQGPELLGTWASESWKDRR